MQAGFGVHAVRQGECASVSVRGEVIRAWVARLQQAGVQCLVRNAFFRGAHLQVFQVPAGNADVQGASGFAAAFGERFAFVEHRLGVAAQRGLDPHGGGGWRLPCAQRNANVMRRDL